MQFSEYLAAILDLCKLGWVAGVGKSDTLHFLIIWTPRNTNLQKNQFWQMMPTGAHFLTKRTFTITASQWFIVSVLVYTTKFYGKIYDDPIETDLYRYKCFWVNHNLDSTTHPKFDLIGVRTHDLQIMTVHLMSLRRLL